MVFALSEYRLAATGGLDEWRTWYHYGYCSWLFLVDAEVLFINRLTNVGSMDLASLARGPIDVFVLESTHAHRFDFRRNIFHLVAIKLNYSKVFAYH